MSGSCKTLAGVDYFLAYLLRWLSKIYAFHKILFMPYIKNYSHYPMQGDCKYISGRLYKPFHSHEWPRQNFSFQYQYNINQTRDENKENYQFGDN